MECKHRAMLRLLDLGWVLQRLKYEKQEVRRVTREWGFR